MYKGLVSFNSIEKTKNLAKRLQIVIKHQHS